MTTFLQECRHVLHILQASQDTIEGVDKTLNTRVGAVIRRHRQKHGLTAQELAEKMDTNSATISRLETGAKIATFSEVVAAVSVLNIPWGEINFAHTDDEEENWGRDRALAEELSEQIANDVEKWVRLTRHTHRNVSLCIRRLEAVLGAAPEAVRYSVTEPTDLPAVLADLEAVDEETARRVIDNIRSSIGGQ